MNPIIPTIDIAPGLTISRLITGLWQIADMEKDGVVLDPEVTAKAMLPYGNAGLSTFDMADHYGSAEVIAGHYKSIAVAPVTLLTKWVPSPGTRSRADVRKAVDLACTRLKTDKIDLLQFHSWNYADPSWLECMFWLDEIRKEGRIHQLGLTNTDTAHLRMVVESGIPVVTNQICYSLLDQRAAGTMTTYCKQRGIQLLAFGTLAGGFLSDRWLNQPEPAADKLTTWSQMKYKRFIDTVGGWSRLQDILQVLQRIGKKHEVSVAAIASRYILEQPAVAGIIIGARPGVSSHVNDNIRLFQFSLDDQDHKEIKQVLQTLEPVPGDCGDEYRRPPFLTASGDLSHHVESMPAPYPIRRESDGRIKAFSGTTWEEMAGYCRAVRKGDRVFVSGTTATLGDRVIGGSDAGAQTHFIIDKIEGSLQSLGSKLEDVVRTRIFTKQISDWEPIARAHGERFRDIQPANTLVQADLIGDHYLVEIEAEAIISRPT
jgi:aryl-alcohol dehydrogenase-like predicted oxidoreductase/enamine deaminase RidA (YjgF/YER057c/UK114 family)